MSLQAFEITHARYDPKTMPVITGYTATGMLVSKRNIANVAHDVSTKEITKS